MPRVKIKSQVKNQKDKVQKVKFEEILFRSKKKDRIHLKLKTWRETPGISHKGGMLNVLDISKQYD